MKNESIIRALAGTVVLTGIVLSRTISPGWIWLSVFAAVNLLQSAFTGFCPPELILKRLGAGKGGRP
jgi:Protein of unknown function (DUF2892)